MSEPQVGRRGFLGRLIGALAGVAAIPLLARRAKADSRWRRWRGRSRWRGYGWGGRSGWRGYGWGAGYGWGYAPYRPFYRGYYYAPAWSFYTPGYYGYYTPRYYYAPGYYYGYGPHFSISFEKGKPRDTIDLLEV